MTNSVGSTKDLNPRTLRRVNFTRPLPARPAGKSPVPWLLQEEVADGEETVGRGAMREHDRQRRQRIERKVAVDVVDLAGIDVLRLERLEYLGIEALAVAAGHRSVFDDDVRRL